MQVLRSARGNALLLVVLLVVQLALMAGGAKGAEGTSVLQTGVSTASRPFVSASRRVAEGIRSVGALAGDLWTARRRNLELEAEVGDLRTEVGRLRELAAENGRLRRLLQMREALAPSSVAATVVTTELSEQMRVLVIDRGTEAGVVADLPVVAWGGAVGRVVWSGRGVAKIRILTDPSSAVAGIVQRSRVEGAVYGRGSGALSLRYVPRHADVALGDRVVTSGRDGVFPKGFGIGRVTAVGEPVGVSRDVRIEPEIDPAGVEEVLVLLDRVGGGILDTDAGRVPR